MEPVGDGGPGGGGVGTRPRYLIVGGGGGLIKKQTKANQRQCTPQYGISASLCQTWLNLKTHTVSDTENRTSCLTAGSQTITVSSCQSGVNRHRHQGRPVRATSNRTAAASFTRVRHVRLADTHCGQSPPED